LNIIPAPLLCEPRPGFFSLSPDTAIHADQANQTNAAFLRSLLHPSTSFLLPEHDRDVGVIRLHLDTGLISLGEEGYLLDVQPGNIEIRAPATTGVFYGLQTLRQLLPPAVESRARVDAQWRIPCVHIEDRPRFSWRGFMLDEGRHFQGKAAVLQALDLMALQKLNVFHWHLTEDQGWRIEIKKYPRLTGIGSCRLGTSRSMLGRKHDGLSHAGFYTQADIREVVAYASARYITIVPEIEMPGHSLAALASYPELSCSGRPLQVATHFGIFPDIFCAGKEATFRFLEDVLDEIMDLFPSPFIHIGGDEAPKSRWKSCPDCQARIREQGLLDENALQVWFTNRIGGYLEQKGRRLMGWNQVLEDGLSPAAVVQFWMGDRRELIDSIRSGRQVVMSTYLDAYLDHSYSLMPLSRGYNYEPVPQELDEQTGSSILGVEFPLWGEWLPDRKRMDYQAYPRLTAMAETAWTPRKQKDLADFRRRLVVFMERLDHFGIRYAPLKDVEPPWLMQRLGLFTIPLPQRKTRD
jgi:hexosaminidase